jgi:predicted nucleic acid-binding Zn ribbon protein
MSPELRASRRATAIWTAVLALVAFLIVLLKP